MNDEIPVILEEEKPQRPKPTPWGKTIIISLGIVAIISGGLWLWFAQLSGNNTQTTYTPTTPISQEQANTDYKLQLLFANNERDYGYITTRGEVKNISNESLKNVEVLVSFYTDDGIFVKSSSALIEYNPILPGQTSPFTTIETDNPAIARYKVVFKFLFGGKILTEDKRS